MKVIIEVSGAESGRYDVVEMPEGPHLHDRMYDVAGRAVGVVYRRDWFEFGNDWALKVWVR